MTSGKAIRILALLVGIGLTIFTVVWQPTTPVIGEWEFAFLMVKLVYISASFGCLWLTKNILVASLGEVHKAFRPISTLPVLLFVYPVFLPISIGGLFVQRRVSQKYLGRMTVLEAKIILDDEQDT